MINTLVSESSNPSSNLSGIRDLFEGFPNDSAKEFTCSSGDVKMWVQSLGGEDPLEAEMATHSSILAQNISWTEEPGELKESQKVTKSWTRLSDWAWAHSTITEYFIKQMFREKKKKITISEKYCQLEPRYIDHWPSLISISIFCHSHCEESHITIFTSNYFKCGVKNSIRHDVSLVTLIILLVSKSKWAVPILWATIKLSTKWECT